jgi:hypothetical protein
MERGGHNNTEKVMHSGTIQSTTVTRDMHIHTAFLHVLLKEHNARITQNIFTYIGTISYRKLQFQST